MIRNLDIYTYCAYIHFCIKEIMVFIIIMLFMIDMQVATCICNNFDIKSKNIIYNFYYQIKSLFSLHFILSVMELNTIFSYIVAVFHFE